MKQLISLCLALLLAAPAVASNAPDAATIQTIEEVLADMQCQMDPDDIEVEDDGYDLDDVICVGGEQFDIKLDLDFNEVSRRAE